MSEEENVLDWYPSRMLSWDDFQADPHPATFQDAISKIFYHPTWTVVSEKFGSELFYSIENIALTTQFQKQLSWVRLQLSNDQLLNHQQGFFDLAEELKPQILEKLSKLFSDKKYPVRGNNDAERMQFAREDSSLMIRTALDRLFEEIFLPQAHKYEKDTNFGENISVQKEYDQRFSNLRR